MNILTKICVVLLAVTSIVASVFFITMATTDNWRVYYESEKVKNDVLVSENQQLMAGTNDAVQKLNEERKANSDNQSTYRLPC